MPNYLIQWRMIQWSKENGCSLYDFRGVSGDLDESNPLYGLYRFKKGFNGEFTEFVGEWDTVYSPFYYLLWTRGMPLFYRGTRRMLAVRRKLSGR
jgi:lipid II:glycine glycyltransferase (peptidoglycan interpeptide bridge formation enzyme)